MIEQLIALHDLDWDSWPDDARSKGLRWKIIQSDLPNGQGSTSLGLATMDVGGMLRRHRHKPLEIYHVISGVGRIIIDNVKLPLRPGNSIFIPPNAWHESANTGSQPLEVLFIFPSSSFDEVVYEFDG